MAAFQIVSFSIEDRQSYPLDTNIPYTLKVKNVSGVAFKSFDIRVRLYNRSNNFWFNVAVGNGAWAANEAKTYQGYLKFQSRDAAYDYLVGVDFAISTQPMGFTKADYGGTQYYDDEVTLKTGVKVINHTDNPQFSALDVYRADADGTMDEEGEILCAKRIALSLPEDGLTHGYGLTVNVTPSVPGFAHNFTLADIVAGVTDSMTAITGAFSKGVAYTITIRVDNGAESAEASVIIPKAFANMHLSGAASGGVRFGGFSTATDDDPKFEVDYPAHFYGGILGGLPDGVYECERCVMAGHVTSSQAALVVTLPFPVGNRKAEDFSLAFRGAVSPRTHTGYMWPASNTSGSDMAEATFRKNTTMEVYSVSPGAIHVRITANSKWYQSGTTTAVQNNSLGDITFNGAFIVTVGAGVAAVELSEE